MPTFRPPSTETSFPTRESDILAHWKEARVFERSVEREAPEYIFYDGPPFATGLPHYGHLVASTLKDVVPRYWTMRGYRVQRRFGWDTHGLPIEALTENELGLSGPSSIREHGVAEFNEACRAGVLRYTEDWRRVVTRLGRWVDFDNDYKTMDPDFMESVWWVFQQLWEKGLVYEDFRVMPYSWRLSTTLSNFEAKSNYKTVQDPAITVAMAITSGERTGELLLVWTTTPWTLPSNLAVAVGEDIEYVRAKRPNDDRVYWIGKDRARAVLGKKVEILGEPVLGTELVGERYTPLFDYFADHENAFVVIASDHVTTADGTGLVHIAPDFGEEDFAAAKKAGIRVLRSVDMEGNFRPAVRDWAGRNVKEADPDIISHLKAAGKLVRHDTIEHAYPYCERSETPLIYMAVPAWFVAVTEIRDRMVEHNRDIHWVPDSVGRKRYHNWLSDARDWNINRNRFWGTPIPIWTCKACGEHRVVGSIADLEEATGAKVTDLHPHKIDHLTMTCGSCGGEAKRIADVFDCWFESGSMPYAQYHYPFENKESFEAAYPAQFIAEGLDQTRGWFYTLLVLSTALFDKPAFKNVVVNGMVLAEDGSKMSKRKKNYPPVEDILDKYGADALRAYLVNSPVVRAEPMRFSEEGVREVLRTVLIPLDNALSFFVQYAEIDGFHPTDGIGGSGLVDLASRSELDRWLISHTQSMVADVNREMEGYHLYNVVPVVVGFVEELTNWYIRLSRRRFWREGAGSDKVAAHATLYETLVTFSKVLAPFLPFFAEQLYQSLVVAPGCADDVDSVHLAAFPQADETAIDVGLERSMDRARQVVRMGRKLRERTKLKVRQPLRKITVVHHDLDVREAVAAHASLVQEELNVGELVVQASGDDLATLTFKANFKTLGRRFGKEMKACAAEIAKLTAADWVKLEAGESLEVLGQPITEQDVVVRREAAAATEIETEGPLVVALDTDLDDALRSEGIAREVLSTLQRSRKDSGLEVTDRANFTLSGPAELVAAVEAHRSTIESEALAAALVVGAGEGEQLIATVSGDFQVALVTTRA